MNDDMGREHQEEVAREDGRLPPGRISHVEISHFALGPVPTFDPATWDFKAGVKSRNRSV